MKKLIHNLGRVASDAAPICEVVPCEIINEKENEMKVNKQELAEAQRTRWSKLSSTDLKRIRKDEKSNKFDKKIINEILKSRQTW